MFKLAIKLAFTAAVAIVGLTAFSGTATASRSLSLAPAGNVLAASLGKLTFRTTIAGAPVNVIACNVTLHGSVSRVIPKVSGTVFGKIHSVLVASCTSGLSNNPRADANLISASGWNLIYRSFGGSLPTPNAVNATVQGAQFLIDLPDPSQFCLYQGDVPAVFNFAGVRPNTNGLVTIPVHSVPLRTQLPGSVGCPAQGQLVGTFGVTPTQTLILVN